MSKFRAGDRVKVEYETEFVRESTIGWATVVVRHPSSAGTAHVPLSALSKLPPAWHEGDVVAIGTHVMRRADNEPNASWWCTCGSRHNDTQVETDWRNGDVEVLRHRGSS